DPAVDRLYYLTARRRDRARQMPGHELLGGAYIEQIGRAALVFSLPRSQGGGVDEADAEPGGDGFRPLPCPRDRLGADRPQFAGHVAFQFEPGEAPALGPALQ